jgi:ABC-2 type transport system permease protein
MSDVAQESAVAKSPAVRRLRPWLVVYVLSWREFVRFFRQRNRVVAAIGTPLLFWLLFGTGLHQSFQVAAEGPSFREYFFPGTLVLILMFTAIFSSISIIQDRSEGFLQSVLVSPAPPWAMVLGKILGATLIAWVQVALCLILVLTLDVDVSWSNALAMIGVLFLGALAMTSMGFVMAWNMESIQGFHAVMNLVLMPMWLLSGSFFPVPALASESGFGQQALHWVMRCNPLTYLVAPLQELLSGLPENEAVWFPSLTTALLVILLFLGLAFALACRISRRRTSGDLL